MAQLIARQIHESLIKNKKTLAVAESCTGGLLSKLLTDFSGSSHYFIMGLVAYSNTIKVRILKIPHRIILEKGAVSEEVARLMAKSARKIAKADIGLGITGIAGPCGGSKEKPVGTVFIAIDTQSKHICKKFYFKGNRAAIRKNAALKALTLLKRGPTSTTY